MKPIDWTKWSAIAEIISSVAILITLLYLAIQTQQNTDAVQASVRQAMLAEDRESLYKIIEFPSLNKRTDLTEIEEVQLFANLIAFIRMRENHWLQYQNGVLDEATWLSYRQPLLNVVFHSAFGRNVWTEQSEVILDPSFVESINSWVSEIELEDRASLFDISSDY